MKAYIIAALLSAVSLLNLPTAPEPLPQPQQAAEDVSAFVQPPEVCDCNCDPERIAKLESLVFDEYAEELKLLAEQQKSDNTALVKRVAALEAKPVQVAQPTPAPVLMPAPRIVQSAPVQSIVQAPTIRQSRTVESYAPRWNNFDGKDRMQHAAEDHGVDVSRYSEAEVLRMLDRDHDVYGGNARTMAIDRKIHANIRQARNPVVVQESVTYSQSTSQPVQQVASSDCYYDANGRKVCPNAMPQQQAFTQQSTYTQSKQSQSGGWYLGKNLGRRR